MGAERARTVLMTADTVGGVWTYAIELSQALASDGWNVHLATMGTHVSHAQRQQASGVPGLTLHESAWKLEWMEDPWDDVERAGAWLLALERTVSPDVVHLNQFAFGALPFRAPVLLVAHSCVLSWWRAVHGADAPGTWDAYRERVANGLSGAGLVGAPTRSMLAALRTHYGFAGEGRVLPNGRRAADFRRAAVKHPVVLSAGRFWDEAKNLRALEDAAAGLPWPVCVAGSCAAPGGGTRQPRHVRALGELVPAALAREMAQAAIYALPARYEPFGLSVLEAALSGCALVLGDIDSLRETWGDAALYVPPGDSGALRDTLDGLIHDAARRAALADAAHARALAYSRERMAGAALAAYEELARADERKKEELTCA